jgi:hypothetical protein
VLLGRLAIGLAERHGNSIRVQWSVVAPMRGERSRRCVEVPAALVGGCRPGRAHTGLRAPAPTEQGALGAPAHPVEFEPLQRSDRGTPRRAGHRASIAMDTTGHIPIRRQRNLLREGRGHRSRALGVTGQPGSPFLCRRSRRGAGGIGAATGAIGECRGRASEDAVRSTEPGVDRFQLAPSVERGGQRTRGRVVLYQALFL